MQLITAYEDVNWESVLVVWSEAESWEDCCSLFPLLNVERGDNVLEPNCLEFD